MMMEPTVQIACSSPSARGTKDGSIYDHRNTWDFIHCWLHVFELVCMANTWCVVLDIFLEFLFFQAINIFHESKLSKLLCANVYKFTIYVSALRAWQDWHSITQVLATRLSFYVILSFIAALLNSVGACGHCTCFSWPSVLTAVLSIYNSDLCGSLAWLSVKALHHIYLHANQTLVSLLLVPQHIRMRSRQAWEASGIFRHLGQCHMQTGNSCVEPDG
jgi:hypothetical protein